MLCAGFYQVSGDVEPGSQQRDQRGNPHTKRGATQEQVTHEAGPAVNSTHL